MNFTKAFDELSRGRRMRRKEWDKAYLYYMPGKLLGPRENIWPRHIKLLAEEQGELAIHPYLAQRTEKGTILIGWMPSPVDLIAEDWVVVKEEEV